MPGRLCCNIMVFAGLFVATCVVWEGRRLYQKEVAKKTAVFAQGFHAECSGDSSSVWTSIKSWMRWQMSWSDPCKEYYDALMVDAGSEVNPLMDTTATATVCIVYIAMTTLMNRLQTKKMFNRAL
uniref:Chloride channel CLIC-like protein 1 n=1 Tax=Branchiostoma floridae TaxID=7739 RepID=C3YKM2_BRAFL|eukprot:XP_002603079.1 hypothetical protein BRAFLDRAFT_63290 [Branchiostoma floridae]